MADMKLPVQLFGYFLIMFSAVLMGLGEGNVIALKFNYILPKVIPILGVYILGVISYLAGLFILANKIGTVIGLWEAVAIGLSLFIAVRELSKKGEKVAITSEIIFFGLLLAFGLFLVIYAGDRFIGFFLKE